MFTAVSFEDGLVSVDKLQRLADNDDFLYNEALSKPRGLIALEERTSNFSNAAGPSFELLFNDITIVPSTATRLFAIYVYLPYYNSGSSGVLESSTINILKNGISIQTGYTDKKYYSGSPWGDHTSFFYGCLDIHPAKIENIYNVQIETIASATYQKLTLSSTRPAQFWIEDLGDV